MPVAGGPAVTLCKTAPIMGATWGSSNVVVFARSEFGGSSLFRVSADGGTPQMLTAPDRTNGERGYQLPHMLPDGKTVLFTIRRLGGWENAQVAARSLQSEAQTIVLENAADARYLTSGHLAFARRGTLMAAPFDLDRLAVTSGPVGIVDNVMQSINPPSGALDTGAAQFSVSATGMLVYVPGGIFPDAERSLIWVSRTGAVETISAPPKSYLAPRLSPDGQRVAVFTQGRDGDLWTYDLRRGTLTRFSTGARSTSPVWSPDGTHIAFGAATLGSRANGLSQRSADGVGQAEVLTTNEEVQLPASWSRDGKTLAFFQGGTLARGDIWTVSLADKTAKPLVQTNANERWADFSPDGQWVAYASDESGQDEIYVQPYPGPGARTQVSLRGGTQPVWAASGRELFYTAFDSNPTASDNKLMVVDVTTQPTFAAGIPRSLASVVRLTVPIRGYDVSPDGQRFITVRDNERPPEPPPAQIVVVQNWFDELKRLLPAK